MKKCLTITIYLLIFGLNLLYSTAVGAEAKWWCPINGTNKIVECIMKDGKIVPIEKEVLYNNFFPEPEVQKTMRKIAKCESGETHEVNGKLVKGVDGKDWGFFQIRSSVHQKKAWELGLDITKLSDQFAFARILYDRNGYRDWLASKKCWNK